MLFCPIHSRASSLCLLLACLGLTAKDEQTQENKVTHIAGQKALSYPWCAHLHPFAMVILSWAVDLVRWASTHSLRSPRRAEHRARQWTTGKPAPQKGNGWWSHPRLSLLQSPGLNGLNKGLVEGERSFHPSTWQD